MRWLAAVCLLPACGFQVPSKPPGDAAPADAPAIDAPMVDAPMVDAPMMLIDAPIDAPTPNGTCDQVACGNAGGLCALGTCVIDRDTSMRVRCPAGMPCRVICNATDSCKDDFVDCGSATTCEVLCSGNVSCQKGVDCGTASACSVTCSGDDACQGDTDSVICRTGSCNITCNGILGNNNTCQRSVNGTGSTACLAHCCGAACADPHVACMQDNNCI